MRVSIDEFRRLQQENEKLKKTLGQAIEFANIEYKKSRGETWMECGGDPASPDAYPELAAYLRKRGGVS